MDNSNPQIINCIIKFRKNKKKANSCQYGLKQMKQNKRMRDGKEEEEGTIKETFVGDFKKLHKVGNIYKQIQRKIHLLDSR